MRRGADILARVLKGAKPADLPVDRAARFEMVVNLETAASVHSLVPKAAPLAAEAPSEIEQDHTLFRCAAGRLKLWDFLNEAASSSSGRQQS